MILWFAKKYKAGLRTKQFFTGYARIDGWAVGIVANQEKVVKDLRKRWKFAVSGGVIYSRFCR